MSFAIKNDAQTVTILNGTFFAHVEGFLRSCPACLKICNTIGKNNFAKRQLNLQNSKQKSYIKLTYLKNSKTYLGVGILKNEKNEQFKHFKDTAKKIN